MSTSSGYYLRRGKSNSVTRKPQTSFRETSLIRTRTNLPDDKSEYKTGKKKVLIPRRSRRLNPDLSPDASEDFLTPDRFKEFKHSRTALEEFPTIKNDKRTGRNFTFEGKRKLKEQNSLMSEASKTDLVQKNIRGKSHKRVIDSNKILNEKKNLLEKNTEYCASSDENSQEEDSISLKRNKGKKKRQQSKVFDESSGESEKEIETKKEKTKVRYRKGKTVGDDHQLGSEKSGGSEDLKVTKRNYRQLKTLPQMNDLESFSLKNKVVKKGGKGLAPSQIITFLDSKRERVLKFNVFSEKELKFPSLKLQSSLQELDVDDDVETDDEQLDNACAKAFEDLLEALTELHGNRKLFKPRYFRDTRNAKKRLMSYYSASTEPNLKPMNTRKRNKLVNSLSSASTSDRSVYSWRSKHEIEEKTVSNCSTPKSFTSDSSNEN